MTVALGGSTVLSDKIKREVVSRVPACPLGFECDDAQVVCCHSQGVVGPPGVGGERDVVDGGRDVGRGRYLRTGVFSWHQTQVKKCYITSTPTILTSHDRTINH